MAEPEPESASPALQSPKAQLDELGLRAKKSFGQNFLADSNMARRIAELATTPAGGTVIELGAGLGALTLPLLARAGRVVAIERDRDLVPYLEQRFAAEIAAGRLEVREADAKTFDYAAALSHGPEPRVLSGNLPYQITGPLLERTVQLSRHISRAVYMVQLEVAERVTAAPGSKTYGALSVFLQAAFTCERALVVKRGAFHPQPGVDSAVILLERRAEPISEETPLLRRLVKDAFAARRKTLRNAWRGFGTSEVEVAAALAGIDLNARGETLHVSDFARMQQALLEGGHAPEA